MELLNVVQKSKAFQYSYVPMIMFMKYLYTIHLYQDILKSWGNSHISRLVNNFYFNKWQEAKLTHHYFNTRSHHTCISCERLPPGGQARKCITDSCITFQQKQLYNLVTSTIKCNNFFQTLIFQPMIYFTFRLPARIC